MIIIKQILLNLILTLFLVVVITMPCYAHIGMPKWSDTNWEIYLNKNVIVAYSEDNLIKAVEGKIILYGTIKNDHTVDKIYSYIVVRTDYGIKVILVKDIEKLEVKNGL